MDTVGSRIKQRREELGMSQEELAKKIGYSSRTTIAKIEAGANNLRQTKIKQIAEALGCDPVWLIGLNDKPKHSSPLYGASILLIEKKLINNDMELQDLKKLPLSPKTLDAIISRKINLYLTFQELSIIANFIGCYPIELIYDCSRFADDVVKRKQMDFTHFNETKELAELFSEDAEIQTLVKLYKAVNPTVQKTIMNLLKLSVEDEE